MSAVSRTSLCVDLNALNSRWSPRAMKAWKNLFCTRCSKFTTLFKNKMICLTLRMMPCLS